MRIGIDFDNTIVEHDAAFARLALHHGLFSTLPEGGKQAIRDALRGRPDGELAWQRLQAQAYGPEMPEARPFPGVLEFLHEAAVHNVEVHIVSHRTERAQADAGVNLRIAALDWLAKQGFFNPNLGALCPERVHFLNSRKEKIDRVRELDCTHFIDDLPEVLSDDSFPRNVEAFLFQPHPETHDRGGLRTVRSWSELWSGLFWFLDSAAVAARARALSGEDVLDARALKVGGNNRLFHLTTATGDRLLKLYAPTAARPNDRLVREREALKLMHPLGMPVPKYLGGDEEAGIAIHEWIQGTTSTVASDEDIQGLVAWLEALQRVAQGKTSAAVDLSSIGPASAACLCMSDTFDQVRRRFERLQLTSEGDLRRFVDGELGPGVFQMLDWAHRQARLRGIDPAESLSPRERALSPSDYGFHNAIRRPEGGMVYCDFEYFGWDDPAKMVADFLLHPGNQVGGPQKDGFFRGASRLLSPAGHRRFVASYPLWALCWCMILLNPFAPERRARYTEQTREQRLVLARSFLAWILDASVQIECLGDAPMEGPWPSWMTVLSP